VNKLETSRDNQDKKYRVPLCPTQKEAFTALSILDSVVQCTDVDECDTKVMDTMQEFLSKIYKDSLKQTD
jgi:hypothetical protein